MQDAATLPNALVPNSPYPAISLLQILALTNRTTSITNKPNTKTQHPLQATNAGNLVTGQADQSLQIEHKLTSNKLCQMKRTPAPRMI
jgi:hypothetical protein